MIRGLIFDLDGTLADSRLDFDAMRVEMELPAGTPILEALDRLPADRAERCRAVLHRHEMEGATRATLLPGVREALAAADERGWPLAIATRNSRPVTEATLSRLALRFELTLTRDDGPVKPDPWPVLHACRQWNAAPAEVVVIGDYRFDVECGQAAGARTVLLSHPHNAERYPNHEQADLVLKSLADHRRLFAWLDSL